MAGGHADGHQHHVDPSELVALDAYRAGVLGRVAPLPPVTLDLLDAHGCVLAEDVAAPADVPAFANSAMDGYAVRAADAVDGAELEVLGEVAAGAVWGTAVGAGQAVRIMTGAPVPPGADAVVPFEVTEEVADEAHGRVCVRSGAAAGENVRPAGEDVRAGDVVLTAGTLLGAAHVGMLAALGRGRVAVRPRPRVVVLSTGDELLEPGAPARPGAIRDANSYALTALARDAGATASRLPIVRDDPDALRAAFTGALARADLLVTSGGVSAGRHDHVKGVLAELGDVAFTKVAMQPGMPQAFGFVDGPAGPVPCFGLPGNPVSAYVSFEVLVRPALRRLAGRADLDRPWVTAVLDAEVTSPAHRVSLLRVTLRRADGEWHARATGPQGSGILRSLVDADGLAEVPADRTRVPAGDRVAVRVLTDGVPT